MKYISIIFKGIWSFIADVMIEMKSTLYYGCFVFLLAWLVSGAIAESERPPVQGTFAWHYACLSIKIKEKYQTDFPTSRMNCS